MNAKKKYKVSVRNLVEYTLRSGDLIFDFGSTNRTLEGLFAHQKLQKSMGDDYKAETHVSKVISYPSFDLHVSGRIDGVYEDKDQIIIDEIKSTYVPLDDIEEDFNPLHWAQAICYGFIYAEQECLLNLIIQLTYVNLDHDTLKRLRKTFTFDELKSEFDGFVDSYGKWVEKLERWNNEKILSIDGLEFPFNDYRRGQRELAVAVYKTIEEGGGQRLFARAPTGTGKTLATLFPAIKAAGRGLGDKIFYLTAKTIGRDVAEKTLDILEKRGLRFRRITLTAKDKMCLLDKRDCSEECPYTKGYYDKINGAVEDILKHTDSIKRDTIIAFSQKYEICPHEYSLDISESCDCIIGDYNYAFDPRVSLKRYFQEDASENILLIDEAHNLVDRGRNMFSANLNKTPMLEMKRLLKDVEDGLSSLFNEVNKVFIEFRKICENNDGIYQQRDYPEKFLKLLRKVHKYIEEFINDNKTWSHKDTLMDLFFEINTFIKISEMYDENFVTYYEKLGQDVVIKLFCLDPSKLLGDTFDKVKAATIFSATLLPMDYFIDLLGGDETSYRITLSSPFEQENLGLYFNYGISTKYKDREHTIDRIANTIYETVSHNRGNYFAFFPSYAYMKKVRDIFIEEEYNESIEIIEQTQGMSEDDKDGFLESFEENREKSLLAFAVMGSSFSEGIDLVGDRLKGVIIIGVGLPQICFERNIIKEHFEKKYSRGFEYSYVFPGMNKVLQAVGRVIRTENDVGVAILIDERFSNRLYQKLFPAEWSHGKYISNENFLVKELKTFWNEEK